MDREKTIQYATKFIKNIPKNSWKKFENTANLTLASLSGAEDKEIALFIIKHNLASPDNLAKFMVKIQIEQITAMYDGFYSIKQDYKNEWKSMLESAKDKFQYALNNPQKKDDELNFARRQVMDCIRIFKNDVIEHIDKIRQIDNQPTIKFFFSSWVSLMKCKEESRFAIDTIERLLNAYHLLFVICSNTQDNISSLVKGFDASKNEITSGDNCLLMAAYCKNKEDKEFWYGLSDLWDEKRELFLEGVDVFRDNTNDTDNKTSFWDDEIDDIDFNNIFG